VQGIQYFSSLPVLHCLQVVLLSKYETFSWTSYTILRPSWLWWYGSWIYNYLCNQCLSPLTLWVRTRSWQGVHDTTLCDKVCQWLATGRCFSPGTPVPPPNKTDPHDIAKILRKVALHAIKKQKFLWEIYYHIYSFLTFLF
jgi:hypothetical protein